MPNQENMKTFGEKENYLHLRIYEAEIKNPAKMKENKKNVIQKEKTARNFAVESR